MSAYEYRHIVGFEETSLIGNVYYTNFLLWQGHCRERFLRDHAPNASRGLREKELAFFTRSCSCDFKGDFGFEAHDEVVIEMELLHFRGGRMKLGFRYYHADQPGRLMAVGSQDVACKVLTPTGLQPAPFPEELAKALLGFADTPELIEHLEDALAFHANPIDAPAVNGESG